jgi:hypothetical protein
MVRYFVAANLWLIFGFVVLLGRTPERVSPTFYSFFHNGWFSSGAYGFILFLCFTIAAAFFVLTWKTSPARSK